MSTVPPPPEVLLRHKKNGSTTGESSNTTLSTPQPNTTPHTPVGWNSASHNTTSNAVHMNNSSSPNILPNPQSNPLLVIDNPKDEQQQYHHYQHINMYESPSSSTGALYSQNKPSLSLVSEDPSSPTNNNTNSLRFHSPVKRHSPLSFADVLASNPNSNSNSQQNSLRSESNAMRVPSNISILGSVNTANADFREEEEDEEGARLERERIMMWEKEQAIGIDNDEDDDDDDI